MPGRFFAARNLDQVKHEMPPLTLGMGYQFDPDKDDINRQKHGYSLESGAHLIERLTFPIGEAPPTVFIEERGRDDGEPRFRLLTLDGEGQIVDFVFTFRFAADTGFREVRAISYRRASYDPELVVAFLHLADIPHCIRWLQHCIEFGTLPAGPPWGFTARVEPGRAQFLSRPCVIPGLIDAILTNSRIELVRDRGGDLERAEAGDATGFERIRLRILPANRNGAMLHDYLFNGASGLRRHYARAPLFGEVISQLILRELRAAVPFTEIAANARSFAELSYDSPLTKLWPEERSLALDAAFDAQPDLDFAPWIAAHRRWHESRQGGGPMVESPLAGNGIQAPQPQCLDIKGAFVHPDGRCWVPDIKIARGEDIYRWGWA